MVCKGNMIRYQDKEIEKQYGILERTYVQEPNRPANVWLSDKHHGSWFSHLLKHESVGIELMALGVNFNNLLT